MKRCNAAAKALGETYRTKRHPNKKYKAKNFEFDDDEDFYIECEKEVAEK